MKAEILAPAGSEQSAVVALGSGADAIYLGIKQFSARESAENFDVEQLRRIIRHAHLLEAKVYVALNTLIKDSELDGFFEAARLVWNEGADAILVQDLFLGEALKRRYPEMVLHLSTQAGCCNVYGAQIAKRYGFSRVVLARETPLAEIKEIAKIIETEVFVQGALCSSFSGQCYFSSFAGGNSGNRGRCKQPCRKKYSIDRVGYEKEAYALSTSDLSVGPRIQELLEAGVTSLKIEGRMRRSEYVGAAVKYYRALLDGGDQDTAFSLLRRTYNRGDYTLGLAFGQEKDFLSRGVQGHIGEQIGRVTFRHGIPVCVTEYTAERGDGFKILRGGREVGGAIFQENVKGGFRIGSKDKLQEGDEVRLTTSVRSNQVALAPVRVRVLHLQLRFVAGEVPTASCEDFTYRGDEPLAPAKNAPLSESEIVSCFCKTDGLPFEITASCLASGAFLPKSALNAFRRNFYVAFCEHLLPVRSPLTPWTDHVELQIERGTLKAEIGEKRVQNGDIFIYKPRDYGAFERPQGTVYLYLPPFLTSDDEALIVQKLPLFDGIFCEGYYGIALAEKYGLNLFAGEGMHVTNRYAALGIMKVARYFTLSKEISLGEQRALSAHGAFVLTEGDVKVMDLIYCPFERTCASCDRKDCYRLTDESGRKFPLRRYRIAGMGCRFEVYNCATLSTEAPYACKLYDNSVIRSHGCERTRGHSERSML